MKMKFCIAEEVSRIITEDLPLPTHKYTDKEFCESDDDDDDDDDDVDTVPMPCPLDEREEKNFIYQNRYLMIYTSLFAGMLLQMYQSRSNNPKLMMVSLLS